MESFESDDGVMIVDDKVNGLNQRRCVTKSIASLRDVGGFDETQSAGSFTSAGQKVFGNIMQAVNSMVSFASLNSPR